MPACSPICGISTLVCGSCAGHETSEDNVHIYREEASPRGETVLRTVGQPTGQSPGMPSIGPGFRLEGLSQLQMLANNSETGIQSPCEATMFNIAAPSVGTCWQASLLPNTQRCSALYGHPVLQGLVASPWRPCSSRTQTYAKIPDFLHRALGAASHQHTTTHYRKQ